MNTFNMDSKKQTKNTVQKIVIQYILVAQTVKKPPAMQETRVWSLVRGDPLEKGMATHSSILAWKNPMDRGVWQATYSTWGCKELDTTYWLTT